MAERDAFGREKGENTLEGLGWNAGSTAQVPHTPVPVSREELPGMADVEHAGIPGTHAPPPRTFPEHRLPGGLPGSGGPGLPNPLRILGRVLRGLVPLAIVVALLVGGVGALVDEISDQVDDIEVSIPDIPDADPVAPEVGGTDAPGASGRPAAPDTPPVGLGRGSLLLRANFAAVKQRLRTGGYGRLVNLRVAPERVDATTVTSDGFMRNLQFVPGGVRELGGRTPGFRGIRTMSIAEINSAAPFRLARSAAGRLRKPATQVNYLVYNAGFIGEPWAIYFKGGEYFRGDERGRITRRLS